MAPQLTPKYTINLLSWSCDWHLKLPSPQFFLHQQSQMTHNKDIQHFLSDHSCFLLSCSKKQTFMRYTFSALHSQRLMLPHLIFFYSVCNFWVCFQLLLVGGVWFCYLLLVFDSCWWSLGMLQEYKILSSRLCFGTDGWQFFTFGNPLRLMNSVQKTISGYQLFICFFGFLA